jgi:hypothetical protein
MLNVEYRRDMHHYDKEQPQLLQRPLTVLEMCYMSGWELFCNSVLIDLRFGDVTWCSRASCCMICRQSKAVKSAILMSNNLQLVMLGKR